MDRTPKNIKSRMNLKLVFSFVLGSLLGFNLCSFFNFNPGITAIVNTNEEDDEAPSEELANLKQELQKVTQLLASTAASSDPTLLNGLSGSGHDQIQDSNVTGNDTTEYLWNGTDVFLDTAKALKPVTDKVTYHSYQTMYGRFLLPYYHLNPSMKFLEIGLGCDMGYGPGASVAVWRKLLPKAELWEAEFNGECVEKHRNGMLRGINLLTGDQGRDTVLDEWIKTSGGDFDIVVDDGGHQNCQIWHSFQKLWPTVKPGGLYFIEDMHVAKLKEYRAAETDTCKSDLIVPEKLKEKLDDLIYDTSPKSDIEFIFCQREACVLGKKK